MKLTIGVMGSSGGNLDEEVRRKSYLLGEAIAARDAILITGGCPGLPYGAVRGARARGGLVVGISPGLSIDEHRRKYGSPVETIVRVSAEDTGACIVHDDDPKRLVDRVVVLTAVALLAAIAVACWALCVGSRPGGGRAAGKAEP